MNPLLHIVSLSIKRTCIKVLPTKYKINKKEILRRDEEERIIWLAIEEAISPEQQESNLARASLIAHL